MPDHYFIHVLYFDKSGVEQSGYFNKKDNVFLCTPELPRCLFQREELSVSLERIFELHGSSVRAITVQRY
ncbi:hypothetical protein V6x_28180 [Gimesia chilikensis]|uniref:Uncharacterized protein n=1 Tax=Gimesia chilikensis TaxID=2605989 RepID=A0A517WCX4_9PLAN|nr:hypothetical protein [Gimesia chilikensis]QDU03106.1 hypothetical protein V6x_28180 [Gimesia chilikensis]